MASLLVIFIVIVPPLMNGKIAQQVLLRTFAMTVFDIRSSSWLVKLIFYSEHHFNVTTTYQSCAAAMHYVWVLAAEKQWIFWRSWWMDSGGVCWISPNQSVDYNQHGIKVTTVWGGRDMSEKHVKKCPLLSPSPSPSPSQQLTYNVWGWISKEIYAREPNAISTLFMGGRQVMIKTCHVCIVPS